MKKNAFTMIELIFVIVVLGILAAVAVPRFAATREDATIAKGRADIASIRSAIATERQTRLITGQNSYITVANMNAGGMFGGVLTYPVAASASNNGWSGGTGGVYTYKVSGTAHTLTYTPADGKFLCSGGSHCPKLAD